MIIAFNLLYKREIEISTEQSTGSAVYWETQVKGVLYSFPWEKNLA